MRHLVTVVHIEDRVGARGGEYWVLTLACGHFKAVRKPRYPAGMLPVAHKFCAPHRVKCLLGCNETETR